MPSGNKWRLLYISMHEWLVLCTTTLLTYQTFQESILIVNILKYFAIIKYCNDLMSVILHVLYIRMCTVSKVSYRYHKTDTGILLKWQINNTFNDTFMMILIRIVSLTQKWVISFLLNACFVFHFYIIWKIMVPEYYYTVCWVYQKEKSEFFNGLVSYRIVSVSFCQYQYCIVS